MNTTKQSGFHVIELVVVFAVIGLIGFVGYKVMQSKKVDSPVANTTTKAVTTVPTVKATKDLETVSSAIDQLDTASNGTDLTSLEQELNSL